MLSNGKYGNSQYFVFLNNEIFKTFFSLHLYNMINSCCKRYAITGETWLCSEARGEKIVKNMDTLEFGLVAWRKFMNIESIWPLIYKTSSLNHCALSSRTKCEKMKHDIVWLMILTLYICIFYTWLKPKDFLIIIYYLGCVWVCLLCIWHTHKIYKELQKILVK